MPTVVTVGELLVECMRPDLDRPLSAVDEFVGPFPSGAPANVVDCIARLGMDAGIVGAVGNDPFGRAVLDRLAGDGVDTARVKIVDDRATGVAFVAYDADGDREFVFHLANAAAGAIGPVDVPPSFVAEADALHVTGSAVLANESMRAACYEAVELAVEHGLLVSFDPNVRPELVDAASARGYLEPIVEQADVLTPTESELAFLTGTPLTDVRDGTEWKIAAEVLLDAGCGTVAVTRGASGCVIFTHDGVVTHPGYAVEALDPTGAGDAFAAAVLVGLLESRSIEEVAAFANAAGASAVTAMGPMEGPVTRGGIHELMDDSNATR